MTEEDWRMESWNGGSAGMIMNIHPGYWEDASLSPLSHLLCINSLVTQSWALSSYAQGQNSVVTKGELLFKTCFNSWLAVEGREEGGRRKALLPLFHWSWLTPLPGPATGLILVPAGILGRGGAFSRLGTFNRRWPEATRTRKGSGFLEWK